MSGVYSIPLNGLKDGNYSYDFEVGDDFFENYGSSEIGNCRIKLVVELSKHSGHYDVVFLMKGEVRVTCDRCLEEYYQSVDSRDRVVVKVGHEFDDNDPELLIIPAGHHELDLRQMIYDFAHLALPIKKVHPEDENGISGCNPEMVALIAGEVDNSEDENAPTEWDILRKLLNEN